MEKRMSSKKSYMNKNNLITEGFFDTLRNIKRLYDLQKKVAKDKKILKNPKVKKAFAAFDKQLATLTKSADDLEKIANEE